MYTVFKYREAVVEDTSLVNTSSALSKYIILPDRPHGISSVV